MKVLLISHTCVSASAGRPKAVCLARNPELELMVLIPDRWRDYGVWQPAAAVSDGCSTGLDHGDRHPQYCISRVRWPWVGPAQWYLHWYPALAGILKSFRPDVIDIWEEPWGLVSAQACWLRNRLLPGTKIISETEQNVEKRLPFPFESFRGYTIRNSSYVIGRNAEALRHLEKKGYAGPSKVVPNAVDEELFKPLDGEACRRRFDIQGFTVGYVGRLVEEKGLLELVEAIRLCPAAVQAVFVGDGPFKAALEKRVVELDLVDRVRFLGPLPPADLPQLMNALAALILPSRTTNRWKEQFGRVIIEAHACGTPVIGSDSGAIPEVVQEGGIIFPEGDAAKLAEGIQRLYHNPELGITMGEKGRSQVMEKYTWKAVADQMYQIYRSLV